MRKNEIIIIVVIAIITILSIYVMNFSSNPNQKNVLITVDNEVYKNIPFDMQTHETYIVETSHGSNTIYIEHGVVKVIEANCPNQVCVHTKGASNVGDMIVCLPHKLVVEITQGR